MMRQIPGFSLRMACLGWMAVLVACSRSDPTPTLTEASAVERMEQAGPQGTDAERLDATGNVTETGAKASLAPAVATAMDQPSWPGWLGPDRTGISAEAGWRSDWSTAPPTVVWRAKIGIGFSAVSVDQGLLFTMGYRDGQDVVHCFSTNNGEKKWERAYPCELVDNLHEGGPGATPTVAGGRVFTLSREGHLHCLSAETGQVLWLREFKREIGAEQPEWGFTSSPLLHGGNVIVDVGFVVAVDQNTGEISWKSPQHRAGYGTPVAFEHSGKSRLAVFSNDGLSIYDPGDGREVTMYPFESQYLTTSTTPIVSGDTLFVSVGYGGGCALMKLAGDRMEPVYTNKEMGNHFNNCVLLDGHLYGFDGNSHSSSQVRLVCMEWATGKVKWHQRGFGCGSLMVAAGKLILLSDSGTLVAATATPEAFRELGRIDVLDGRCWTMPVLVGGKIYCRNAAGDLVCVDVGA